MHGVPGEARYRTIEEPRIVELLVMNGWRFDVTEGRRDAATAAAQAALDRCVAVGLPFNPDGAGRRRFDPVETVNFLVWADAHAGETVWRDHCVASGRRQVQETPGPSRFTVSLTRTFNLAARRRGETLRLRLPGPLEESTLSGLTVEWLPLPDGVLGTSDGPGRLDALVRVGDADSISLGWRATFATGAAAPAPAPALSVEDAALFTRPAEGLIKVNARVAALAADITRGETRPLSVVRRCWDHVFDSFACGAIHYDALDPENPLDWLLDHGWYDCKLGSALLAALLRSRGIPARLVTGYMLHVAGPAFHTWVEAWVDGDGWTPMDFWAWGLSEGGRDPRWRNHYFGSIDPRLIVERPPRLFGGTGAIRLPRRFHLLMAITDQGARATFEDADTGEWSYHEDVAVTQAPLDQARAGH